MTEENLNNTVSGKEQVQFAKLDSYSYSLISNENLDNVVFFSENEGEIWNNGQIYTSYVKTKAAIDTLNAGYAYLSDAYVSTLNAYSYFENAYASLENSIDSAVQGRLRLAKSASRMVKLTFKNSMNEDIVLGYFTDEINDSANIQINGGSFGDPSAAPVGMISLDSYGNLTGAYADVSNYMKSYILGVNGDKVSPAAENFADLDAAYFPGSYRIEGSNVNGYFGSVVSGTDTSGNSYNTYECQFGNLLVVSGYTGNSASSWEEYSGADTVAQIGFDSKESKAYVRCGNVLADGGSWDNWAEIVTSSNYKDIVKELDLKPLSIVSSENEVKSFDGKDEVFADSVRFSYAAYTLLDAKSLNTNSPVKSYLSFSTASYTGDCLTANMFVMVGTTCMSYPLYALTVGKAVNDVDGKTIKGNYVRKFYGLPVDTDINNYYESGFYRLNITNGNGFPGYSYGQVISCYGGGDSYAQIGFDTSNDVAYFRTCRVDPVNNWSDWHMFLTNDNYSSYALGKDDLSAGTKGYLNIYTGPDADSTVKYNGTADEEIKNIYSSSYSAYLLNSEAFSEKNTYIPIYLDENGYPNKIKSGDSYVDLYVAKACYTKINPFELADGSGLYGENATDSETAETSNYYLCGVSLDDNVSDLGNVFAKSYAAFFKNDSDTYSPIGPYLNANTIYFSSDRSLKENIRPLTDEEVENAWNSEADLINKFRFKNIKKDSIGFIAQDIKAYFPEAVSYSKATNTYSVDYNAALSGMIGVLVNKVKQLEKRIEELEKNA